MKNDFRAVLIELIVLWFFGVPSAFSRTAYRKSGRSALVISSPWLLLRCCVSRGRRRLYVAIVFLLAPWLIELTN